MVQLQLTVESPSKRVVNVASVPQRSPFRYPGGKTWLVPWIRRWLLNRSARPNELAEPFAGGAIVSLTAVFENLVERATLVELDTQVASVWKTILSDDWKWLVERIGKFELTSTTVREELAKPCLYTREMAFQTLLKNRVYHGGILAPGSGLIKRGEDGKGVKSRWYPETLAKRIERIARLSERIQFIEGDGMEVLRHKADSSNTVFFVDPPYTAGGKKAGLRLYTHYEVDHEELFNVVATLQGDFLMTYDNEQEVREFARRRGFDVWPVPMKGTHHVETTELLVGRDLTWARD